MKKLITMMILTVGMTFGFASVSQAQFNLESSELQAPTSVQQIIKDDAVVAKWGWWWW